MAKRSRNHRGVRQGLTESVRQPLWARELWRQWSEANRVEFLVIARALRWLLSIVEGHIIGLEPGTTAESLDTFPDNAEA